MHMPFSCFCATLITRQNLNSGSDIANNEEPILSDIADNVVSESPIPGYDNSRINPRPARSCDIFNVTNFRAPNF